MQVAIPIQFDLCGLDGQWLLLHPLLTPIYATGWETMGNIQVIVIIDMNFLLPPIGMNLFLCPGWNVTMQRTLPQDSADGDYLTAVVCSYCIC